MLSPTHLLTPGEHFYCITSILQMAKLRLRQVRTRATIPKPLPFASQLYGDMCTTQKALIVVNSLCLPAKPVIKNNPHSAQCPLPSPALWAVQCTDGWGLPCGAVGPSHPSLQPLAQCIHFRLCHAGLGANLPFSKKVATQPQLGAPTGLFPSPQLPSPTLQGQLEMNIPILSFHCDHSDFHFGRK